MKKKPAKAKPRKITRDVWLARVNNYDMRGFNNEPAIEVFAGERPQKIPNERGGRMFILGESCMFFEAISPETAKSIFGEIPKRHGRVIRVRVTTEVLP